VTEETVSQYTFVGLPLFLRLIIVKKCDEIGIALFRLGNVLTLSVDKMSKESILKQRTKVPHIKIRCCDALVGID